MKKKKKKTQRQLMTWLHNGFILDYLHKMSEADIKLYIILAMHANWHSGEACPTMNTIQNESGLSRQAIRNARKHLQNLKLISVEFRKPIKNNVQYGRPRFFYTLTCPPMKPYEPTNENDHD